MNNYVHHIPGRLRVRIARVKGNPVQARTLEALLVCQKGIQSVNVNTTTGSVLVHYDPAALSTSALMSLPGLKTVGPSAITAESRPARESIGINQIAKRVVYAAAGRIAEILIERAALALLAAVL